MVDKDSAYGYLKKSNPAVVLNGEEDKILGMVQVEQVDREEVREAFSLFGSKSREPYSIEPGPRTFTLEGSFNRDGDIYVYQGDLEIAVEKGFYYYLVAGLETNAGKIWMWIQDHDLNERISGRVEA